MRENPAEVIRPECEAPRRRHPWPAPAMQEDRAARPWHWRIVMIRGDDDVVQPIGTAHPFGRGGVGQGYRRVVGRIGGVVAPSEPRRGRRHGQRCRRARDPVGAPPPPHKSPDAGRGGAVAFALGHGWPNATPSDGAGQIATEISRAAGADDEVCLHLHGPRHTGSAVAGRGCRVYDG